MIGTKIHANSLSNIENSYKLYPITLNIGKTEARLYEQIATSKTQINSTDVKCQGHTSVATTRAGVTMSTPA